jgi:hypothetical protein
MSPACRKQFNTVSQYIDHISHDVLAYPDMNIRRRSGEQDVILSAAPARPARQGNLLLAWHLSDCSVSTILLILGYSVTRLTVPSLARN